jgi:hypothetical protein
MKQLEKRIAGLEKAVKEPHGGLHLVFVRDGEDVEKAKKHAGLPRDARKVVLLRADDRDL